MKSTSSRPPYRGNMKLKGAKIPGVDDYRDPDRAHRKGYNRREGNEITDFDDVTLPGRNAASEARRTSKKKRRGRYSAIEAAHALACRTKGSGKKQSSAFFEGIGYE